MNDINEYFNILGLKPGASIEQVKEAYRDLVRVWHPDRFAHDPKLQAKAQEKLKEINEAYAKIQEFLDHLNAYQQATGADKKAHSETHDTDKENENQSAGQSSKSKEEYQKSSQEASKEPPKSHLKTSNRFAWKTYLGAIVIAFILNIVVGGVTGSKPTKNIVWTTLWIYQSIDAWKFWRWKALIPYPAYIACAFILSAILMASGVEERGMPILIVLGASNIGGLIIFYILLQRSVNRAARRESNNWFSRHYKGILATAIVLLIIAAIAIPGYLGMQERDRKIQTQNEQAPAQSPAKGDIFDQIAEEQKSAHAPTPVATFFLSPSTVIGRLTEEWSYSKPITELTNEELFLLSAIDDLKDGKYNEAIRNSNEAMKYNPYSSDAYVIRGSAYGMLRNNLWLDDYRTAARMGNKFAQDYLVSVYKL